MAILALALLALIGLLFKFGILSRVAALSLAVGLWIFYRWIGPGSAKAMRAKKQQELEQLRNTPVLHLDD